MNDSTSLPQRSKSQKAAIGLLGLLLVLCFGIVVLGGFVRLSGSGLAIPEWPFHTTKVHRDAAGNVIGKDRTVLPPSTDEGWETLRQTFIRDVPGFQAGIDLQEFKTMFFIEWSHRATGSFITLLFLVLAVVVFKDRVLRGTVGKQLLAAGIVLPVQIVLGGILVRLHLEAEALATHLVGAFLFTSLLFWMFLKLVHPPAEETLLRGRNPILKTAWVVYVLVLCQIFSGGLMAGTHAGFQMNFWPKMSPDAWIVPGLFDRSLNPIANFTENPIMVQFFHRWFAFVVLIAVVYLVISSFTAQVSRVGRWFLRSVTLVVVLQIMLGIVTLIGINERIGPVHPHIALTHQSIGLVLVLTVLGIVYETMNHPVKAEERLAEEEEVRAQQREAMNA